MNKILVYGPMEDINDSKNTGGIIVLFMEFLHQCKLKSLDYSVIDTNKSNYKNKLFSIISILFLSLILIPRKTHITLHGTANDFLYIGPFIVFISKLLNKKISLRKFAGNFDEIYKNSTGFSRSIYSYVIRNSDFVFFETNYLVKKFKKLNRNVSCFPNVRKNTNFRVNHKFSKRFVFLGHVSKEKGIMELLDVSNQLDNSYIIDIYGPIVGEIKNVDFENFNVNYMGTIKPEFAQNLLSQYNVLVLPSYREGYPGVIIEALSVAMPIIASNLTGINEMIDYNSSILIKKKSVPELREAIVSFNEKLYSEKSKSASLQFQKFESNYQTKLFFNQIFSQE